MGFSVCPSQGPGERYDRDRFRDDPFTGTKYVDAEWFIELCNENAIHTYDDYDRMGGGGFYARIDPAKIPAMRVAICEHNVNVEVFTEWLEWLGAHPDAYIQGYH